MGGAIAAAMLLVSLAVNGAGVGSAQAGEPEAFRLVINPESPATQVDRAFIADAFL